MNIHNAATLLAAALGAKQLPAGSGTTYPRYTQGLHHLEGSKILVLADGENLSYGLKPRGLDIDFEALLKLIRKPAKSVAAHAFATVQSGDAMEYASAYFKNAGWLGHIMPIQKVGHRTRANADNLMLINAGHLMEKIKPTMVVLCTGDGDLGDDIAHFVKGSSPTTKIATMSVPGTLSKRLFSDRNKLIAANLYIGMDVICRPALH